MPWRELIFPTSSTIRPSTQLTSEMPHHEFVRRASAERRIAREARLDAVLSKDHEPWSFTSSTSATEDAPKAPHTEDQNEEVLDEAVGTHADCFRRPVNAPSHPPLLDGARATTSRREERLLQFLEEENQEFLATSTPMPPTIDRASRAEPSEPSHVSADLSPMPASCRQREQSRSPCRLSDHFRRRANTSSSRSPTRMNREEREKRVRHLFSRHSWSFSDLNGELGRPSPISVRQEQGSSSGGDALGSL